jgi:hypothetical protein
MSKHICDCGAEYSNLDALLACQNANHGLPNNPSARLTKKQFRNALCILRSIDAHELGDPPWWPQFQADPYDFYLRCDYEREQLIWFVVEARMVPA